MVRRTRTEIEKYFGEDIKNQNLKFPDVEKPVPLFYELNDTEDEIFNKTIELIAKEFNYARYMTPGRTLCRTEPCGIWQTGSYFVYVSDWEINDGYEN